MKEKRKMRGNRRLFSGGKQRTKTEVQLNSQHQDAGGDTRRIVTAMMNNEKNQHRHPDKK